MFAKILLPLWEKVARATRRMRGRHTHSGIEILVSPALPPPLTRLAPLALGTFSRKGRGNCASALKCPTKILPADTRDMPVEIADSTIARIVDYALALDFARLPPAVVHECKRRLIDTFGCAIAGFDEAPSGIARAVALRSASSRGALVLGTRYRALPELACFANGVMARCLDGNDCFPGGGGHPSSVIPAVFAAAALKVAGAREIIAAIVLGYDVHYRLWKACNAIRKGFDHALYAGIAAAASTAKVLRLDRVSFGHALALAITLGPPLAVTRRGELSMWKGCAEAQAAHNGLFAAILAQRGMVGPARAINGAMGLGELFAPFELAPFPGEDSGGAGYAILRADIKQYVTEYHSQGPLVAALKLRDGIDLAEITRIAIDTYDFAYREIGSGPEKWRPVNRETADHSIPYVVAAALHEGKFSDAAFAPERFTDPAVLAIADKITIREDDAFNRDFPDKLRCRVEITTRNGAVRSASLDYPHGHHLDPLTDHEVEDKFRELAARKLPGEAVEATLEALWNFETAPQADAVLDLFTVE